ncbi:iron-containing alcohol dehydrogenase [Pseudoalteromonas sp. MMG012]|uniref:iron-containing alcohol dehydrogenase n=1 Tax=Pseudoalteromonas sp. MMG012 TaxID=2822686 RepID=UPI001B39E31E|nr:iron-containing alcohol dehydrogenase [Pseudoalteromonas sp. MMG012]MBQ4848788.1 iron-containing alcohol dehydrogenase [Pseudoalteromonas sp. MMG012]
MLAIYRAYHFILKCIVIFIGIPNPLLHRNRDGLTSAISALKLKKSSNVLLVTDQTLHQLDITKTIITALNNQHLNVTIYNQVLPNPTIDNVETGFMLYRHNRCQAIISVGGGSVIDCAKLIGAKVARPTTHVKKFKGLFKVLKRLPPNIAIPTTAGTGSETTVAAVVNDPLTRTKYAATDFALVPHHAVMLPELTISLPPHITATTAMDALTHAIEALLSINCMSFSEQRALAACALIFENLPKAYTSPSNIDARASLLEASFYAGQAFTRTSVGYVHAISHQLSACYNTPHGLANAVLLVPVLEWYGPRVQRQLAQIARYCQLTSIDYPIERQAEDTLTKIKQLLAYCQIQSCFTEINILDIEKLTRSALAEAHPDYPVPFFMEADECEGIIKQVTATT